MKLANFSIFPHPAQNTTRPTLFIHQKIRCGDNWDVLKWMKRQQIGVARDDFEAYSSSASSSSKISGVNPRD